MKIFTKKNVWVLASLMLAVASCASYPDVDVDENEKKLLEAYVSVFHLDTIKPTASGLYFINELIGTGAAPLDTDFVFVNYIAYDLSGNVILNGSSPNSNVEHIAQQLGMFAYTDYYGPRLWGIGRSTLYVGLEEALQNMRVGGKARVLMPSWLSIVGGGERNFSTTVMFEIELLRVVHDITSFQKDSLASYNTIRNYNANVENDGNLYFLSLSPGTGNVANLNDTFNVRYVGYLIDDFVFDTNIADSAIYHRIYDKSKQYETMNVVYAESMDVVDGFKFALQQMKSGSEAIVFFTSDLGYKNVASGQIQPYSPLCFYIKMERIGVSESN